MATMFEKFFPVVSDLEEFDNMMLYLKEEGNANDYRSLPYVLGRSPEGFLSDLSLDARAQRYVSLGENFKWKLQEEGGWGESRMDNSPEIILGEYRENALIDFKNFVSLVYADSPIYQRIFLGSDGFDYTMPMYSALDQSSIKIVHDINRKHLAMNDEFDELYNEAYGLVASQSYNWGRLSDNEQMYRISEAIDAIMNDDFRKGNSCLEYYGNLSNIISSSATVHRNGEGNFNDVLREVFDDEIMNNSVYRSKTLDLLYNFVREPGLDISRPILLIDYVGNVHAQSFMFREALHWMSQESHWNLLNQEEQNKFVGMYDQFSISHVDLRLSVTDVEPSHGGFAKVYGLKIDEVHEKNPLRDSIVDYPKSYFQNPFAFLNGKIEYLPTSVNDQSETLGKCLMLIDIVKQGD
ncbi:MAG: hypothetical protein ACI83O_000854 [Patescibacteria group bacterium]|jgi:hypothetical protein